VKYSDDKINIREIKAETLVSQMDTSEHISACMNSIFSRNYSEDLIDVTNDMDRTILEISRDGIFHLLPEGLFFRENIIKNILKEDFKEKHDQFLEDKKSIAFFFQPFDTEYFRQSLEYEKTINDITEKGNRIFNNSLFDEADTETDNEYINRMKVLLPFVSTLKGNHALLADILVHVLSLESVEFKEIEPFYIRFIFHKGGLVQETFNEMNRKVGEFFDFFYRWFLYVELEYDYRIKYYKNFCTFGNTLLLDYNTHF